MMNWKCDHRAALWVVFILLSVECAVPMCARCDEFDDIHTSTEAQPDSGYGYDGAEYIENAAFLADTVYILEWYALSKHLWSITPEGLTQLDALVLLYVKDLHQMGFDAYLNVQQTALSCPDSMIFLINYGAACRAYERTVLLAPMVSDPLLQELTHDLRVKLRVLALKIEKLFFGKISPGQEEPSLLLWRYGDESSGDSTAARDR